MKVRMRVSIAAMDWAFSKGQIVNLQRDQALTWCDAGLAEPIEPADPPSLPKQPAKKRRKKT